MPKNRSARGRAEGRHRQSRQLRRAERLPADRRRKRRRGHERRTPARIRPNYFYSFPANRIELWFLLESRRFLHPVFREFYKERDVVREERRMRVESDPQGKLMETAARHLLRGASLSRAHRRLGERHRASARRGRAAFYNEYYVPANITIGIAGDVSPAAGQAPRRPVFLARRPPSRCRIRCFTAEPQQEGEKRVAVETPRQPLLRSPTNARPDRARTIPSLT